MYATKMRETPQLRHLPHIPSDTYSKPIQNLETAWEIDVRDITWSVTFSYLMTVPVHITEKYLQTFLRDELSLSENKILAEVRRIKKAIRRFNPFQKLCDTWNNRSMKSFVNSLRNFLSRDCHKIKWRSILQNAADFFKSVICLYSVNSQENCQFLSLFEPTELHGDCPKLIIFSREKQKKYNFGLPSKLAECKIQYVLNKVLRQINMSNDEIREIPKIISSGKNFLICLLQSSRNTIIPTLYKPPYIARKLAEVGFVVDPRLTDENGFSAFHYCMDLPETHLIWLLYNFAANMSYLKDHNVRNPNVDARDTLREIGSIIKRDILRGKNLSATYIKTAGQILLFNQYQSEVVEETLRLKQTKDSHILKMKFILEKYEEYFYFKSPLYNDALDLKDKLALFRNFLLHSEYHENLDVFTSMMFFDELPHITVCINETNRSIFTDTLSSIFLSILSNKFFPKYVHESGICHCGMHPDKCEFENNARRFVAFHYRQCFLEQTTALANEVSCSVGVRQSSSIDLLEIIRSSLTHLPDIEDEFMIVRIKLYLTTATDSSDQDNESTRMLIFERALQVIGEILSNETVSKTVVRFLISSCLPAKLRKEIIKIRHHGLSHHRSSSIQGRVNMESKDHVFLDSIHQELHVIDQVTKSVFDCQRFRVEEFLIKNFKTKARHVSKNITFKLDKHLFEIISKRKEIFLSQKENFSFHLLALFNHATEKLNDPKTRTIEDLNEICESLSYLLEFVESHWEEYSMVLVHIREKLKTFISNINSKKITDDIKLQLNQILLNNLRIMEDVFSKVQICELPFNFPYSVLPSLFSEMKDFDPFSLKEKIIIKQNISEFIRKSNETMRTLIQDCLLKRNFDSPLFLGRVIAPENIRSKLSTYFSKIHKMNKLLEACRDTKEISNSTLFKLLYSNIDNLEIFSLEEKGKIRTFLIDVVKLQKKLLIESTQQQIYNDPRIVIDQDPIINEIRNQLNIIFLCENKRHLIEQSIAKNINDAEKILTSKSFEQDQKLETWYKNPNNDNLNLELDKEEHLSVLFKIALPKNLKQKLIRLINKKMWFVINRISHMKRLLISEDGTIFSLWKSGTWKDNKDEEKHLKSLMIQRFLSDKGVKMSLEMLLFDCMLILKSDDLADLWKKTNNMFIGSNMIQILAHGNPLIEGAGSILDSTDLPSDFIDKILNLINDERILRLLSSIWVSRRTCKESCLKEHISRMQPDLYNEIQLNPKIEKYFRLLPLRR